MSRSYRIGRELKTRKARARNPLWCHYCGQVATTWDHIVPKALGGLNARWNLTPSCQKCNAAKADDWPTCECRECRQACTLVNSYRG